MKITCVSDLHGETPQLDGGDLLIVAGDLTGTDKLSEYEAFVRWLNKQDYKKKIVIAGNHDGLLETEGPQLLKWAADTEYLQDSATEFNGLKIWGSPWTPEFCDWHFMLKRGDEIKAKWDLIPDDIDLLVTHGPPATILDVVPRPYSGFEHVGCVDLLRTLKRLKNLKLHVFGHIHSDGLKSLRKNDILFVNSSILDDNYQLRKGYIKCNYQNSLYMDCLIQTVTN